MTGDAPHPSDVLMSPLELGQARAKCIFELADAPEPGDGNQR